MNDHDELILSKDPDFNFYIANRDLIIKSVKKMTYGVGVVYPARGDGLLGFENYPFLYTEDELENMESAIAKTQTGLLFNYIFAKDKRVAWSLPALYDTIYNRFITIGEYEEDWKKQWAVVEQLLVEFIDMRAERRNQQILAQKNENNDLK